MDLQKPFIAQADQAEAQAQEAQKLNSTGLQKLDIAGRTASDTQAFEKRRNS
jgi:hypothetical protein